VRDSVLCRGGTIVLKILNGVEDFHAASPRSGTVLVIRD
jgi:hypothetical protein